MKLYLDIAAVNFLLQVMAVLMFFCFREEKRSRFAVRFIVLSIVGLVGFFFLPKVRLFGWWNPAYFLAFIYSSFVMMFCFKLDFKQVLVYDIAAASLQNLVSKAFGIICLAEPLESLDRTYLFLFLSDIVFAASCALMFVLYTKRFGRMGRLNIGNLRFGILLAVTVAIVFVLSYLCDLFAVDKSAKALCLGLLILVDLMVLFAEFGVFETSKVENDNAVIERMLKVQGEQHRLFESNIELLNIKAHDLKHRVQELKSAGENEREKYIAELEQTVKTYDSEVRTGNRALDIVLTEYAMLCEKRGIRFSPIADGGALEFMESSDVYSFFGNALENAVEALSKVSDETQRLLTLSVKRVGNVVSVEVENRFTGELPEVGKSSKGNDGMHGFGLKSMKYIADKYGGVLSVSNSDGFFTVLATFSV